MTETIGYMIGAISFAGILTGLSAWLDKPRYAAFRARWTREAMVARLGHWCFAWIAGNQARVRAKHGYYEGLKGKETA